MNFSLTDLGVGLLLALVQFVASLPWLAVVFFSSAERLALWRGPRTRTLMARLYNTLLVPAVAALALTFLIFLSGSGRTAAGYVYAAFLQLQLTADLFILFFVALLWVWPKGGAVAQAAFREGVRQPMFWLLGILAFLAMFISPFIPYFTFGEDYIVVKELGYDTIMLFAAVFGALAASLFVSEEIEGRTALTLMSKPVSRRQFLLGKFVGILLACLALFGFLGLWFEVVLLFKHWFDRMDPVPPPAWLTTSLDRWGLPATTSSGQVLFGAGRWLAHTLETLPGLLLCFMQVMVLVAIAVALATRLPMVVNLVTILVIYFVAHLTPVLVAIGRKAERDNPNSPVSRILSFMSQLFDALLPGLEFFRVSPPLLGDSPPPAGPLLVYLGSVAFYGVLYTLIVLFFGLILFEDRDLA
jgi:ABC-type transport system involved in multi-copper enzyme maturation permease subunit